MLLNYKFSDEINNVSAFNLKLNVHPYNNVTLVNEYCKVNKWLILRMFFIIYLKVKVKEYVQL
ncbi:hypothetical protein CSCA_1903 [Clostridium scatologenes]|uniref:Uncharacterized protein n=1 Tax=Clostridium scatologenes TaxID=1548 RepID=A0A0E3M924_CLOSL|nr:hypothetical protein CSCA_1903 [Clostridium scatologenes]